MSFTGKPNPLSGRAGSEALRRFVDTHRPELMEKFIHADVEWGLHGNE
jgi:hypothetical protein